MAWLYTGYQHVLCVLNTNKKYVFLIFNILLQMFLSLEMLTEPAGRIIIHLAGGSTNTNILLDCELLAMLMYVSETSHCFQLICHAERAPFCSRWCY